MKNGKLEMKRGSSPKVQSGGGGDGGGEEWRRSVAVEEVWWRVERKMKVGLGLGYFSNFVAYKKSQFGVYYFPCSF